MRASSPNVVSGNHDAIAPRHHGGHGEARDRAVGARLRGLQGRVLARPHAKALAPGDRMPAEQEGRLRGGAVVAGAGRDQGQGDDQPSTPR